MHFRVCMRSRGVPNGIGLMRGGRGFMRGSYVFENAHDLAFRQDVVVVQRKK